MCSESSEINENFRKKRSCPAKLRGVLSLAVRSHVQSRDSNDSHLGLATYFLANRIFYCSPRALIGNRLSRNAKTASGKFWYLWVGRSVGSGQAAVTRALVGGLHGRGPRLRSVLHAEEIPEEVARRRALLRPNREAPERKALHILWEV